MAVSNSQITILTLNVNGLNAPIKRQTGKLDKKPKPISMLYPDPSHMQRYTKTQNKGMEEDLSTKWRAKTKQNKTNQKTGVAILVSDKIDFKVTKTKRNKEGHYIMVKGSMEEEELMILNIYALNTGAPRYIRQVLNDLQKNLDSHTITVGDFYTPLSILDRSTRQKINKDIQDLNSVLDQANLIDIYRPLHSKSTEYTFFSAPYHTYSETDHIIGSKSILSKCKRRNHNKQSLRPQYNQVRTQNSETNSELHSFMETKQLAFEC